MSAKFRIDGLADQLAQLASLPQDLTDAAAPDVEASARSAETTIRNGYPSRTGDLRDKLDVLVVREDMRVRAIVINRSPHAAVFERGSQARHTALGAYRGSMPANPLFTATVIRERRAMLTGPIPGLLRAFGMEAELRG